MHRTPEEVYTITEEKLLETPKSVPSKKKAFRRRSSITDLKGRRSGVFCFPPNRCFAAYQELSDGIPQDLPECERLEILNRNLFEFTLQKLEQELSDVQALPEAFKNAREAFPSLSDDLKKQGRYQEAFELECYLPVNPPNFQIEETIKDYESLTNTLEGENKEWNQLVQKHKNASLLVPRSHIVNEGQYIHLTPEQQAVLQDQVDCRRIQNDMHNHREALKLQISKMNEFLFGASRSCEKSNEICSSKMKTLRETAIQACPQIGVNPKGLIQKMQEDNKNKSMDLAQICS